MVRGHHHRVPGTSLKECPKRLIQPPIDREERIRETSGSIDIVTWGAWVAEVPEVVCRRVRLTKEHGKEVIRSARTKLLKSHSLLSLDTSKQ